MKMRTKALIPFVVLSAGRPIAERIARRKKESHRKRWIAAIVAVIGAAGGLTFWFRHRPKGPTPV